jgi:hypothetical protein
VRIVAVFLLADLLWFGIGRYSQCDPALYYPRIPALEQLARADPGRVIGYSCLPALLASTHGLRDIRGYDPIVPARLFDLMKLASDPRSAVFDYGLMQWLTPVAVPTPEGGIRLPPVLDMLNVRYVIFRGSPGPSDHPFLQGPDYFVLPNRSALPRAFIPSRVEAVPEDTARLGKLGSANFNPREVAYVESSLDLTGPCRGTAEIIDETPTRVRLAIHMETSGLVILSDLWDRGWQAYLDGKLVPILRANHAVRGVLAPAGSGVVEFRYEPASFALGVRLAGLAFVILLAWAGMAIWKKKEAALDNTSTAKFPTN